MAEFCAVSNVDLVNRLTYFADSEPEAKQEIATRCHRIEGRQEGSVLFDVDDLPRGFVIVSGLVELTSKKHNTPLGYFGAGSVLGDDALLSGAYQYSAIARTPCHLLVLGDWYRTLAIKFPGVRSNIYKEAQRRRDALEDFRAKFLRASKSGRVAVTLQCIAQAIEQPQVVEDRTARLPFTVEWLTAQQNISDLLLVSRPKVREALDLLRKEGAIELNDWSGEQITLPLTLREQCVECIERVLQTHLS